MQGSIQQQNDPNGQQHIKDDMLSFNSPSNSSFQYLNMNAVHEWLEGGRLF